MEPQLDVEGFRSLTSLLRADARWELFYVHDEATGDFRPMRIDDHHATLAGIQMGDAVPDATRASFETARNACLYAWFVYRFMALADQQAFFSLEGALRQRLGKDDVRRSRHGLKKLLNIAASKKLLSGERFEALRWVQTCRTAAHGDSSEVQVPTSSELLFDVIRLLPRLRNLYAHGQPILVPGYTSLALCCDLINQLYSDRGD